MSDREKLIELLLTEPWTIQARGNSKRFAAAGRVADRLLANGVIFATENHVGSKWIPVTERLPEGGELVLAGDYRDRWVGRARFLPDGSWYVRTGFLDNDEITHWMPLPEPPMRKGENG